MTAKGSSSKRRVVLVVVVGALLVAAVGAFFYVLSTPYYSLYMLKKGILNRNSEQVLKYLDTDSILDNIAKDVVTRMERREPPRSKAEEELRKAGKDLVVQLLPQLKPQAGEAITTLLFSSGNDAFLNDLRKAPVLALSVTVRGNTAEVRERGKNELIFTMARATEGHWRINWLNPDKLKFLK